jgi:hypothetical protein
MGDLPLPLHSYKLDTVSSARLVNVFAEAAPKGAKGPIILRRSPGIAPFCAAGAGPGRGLHTMKKQLYAVSGNGLYRIDPTAAATRLGNVSGRDPVSMCDNGIQLAVSSGSRLSVFDAGAVVPVSDPDVPNPLGSIDFIDSYLVGVHEGTGQFVSSALEDFTDFDALDFATAEGAPDDLLTLIVDHRSIFLLGEDSAELWDNEPQGADFPFARIPNGFIEMGGAAKEGKCKQDNSIFWLANDRTFRRLTGGTPERVSQHGVETAWKKFSTVSDAQCHPYTLSGHLCIAVRFPSENSTWVYDCTTTEWHERESYPGLAWDVSGIQRCYDKIFVQRASTGEIGVLDSETYREWGQTLRSEWAYQNIYGNQKGVQIHRLEMGVQTGVGLHSGQGSDPRINLELSRLGGREGTFKPIPSRSLGAQGTYKTKVHWDSLGTGVDNVFRASLSDPVPLTIWNTQVNAEGLVA